VGSGAGTQLHYSPGRIDPTNAAFNASRKPLAGEFMFNGHHLFVIANHWNSKSGDQPLFGVNQPPAFISEIQRNLQATVVHDFVNAILTADPSANVLVMGDLNDFQFSSALATLKEQLAAMIDVLEGQAERAESIEQCRVRAVELAAALDAWKADQKGKVVEGDQAVLWVEAFSSSLQMHKTPLSIAPIFSNQREGTPRSWIFTSATLAVKNDFKHFSDQMGLAGEEARTWPSPFNYEQQGLLYVPTGLPEPNAFGYTDAVVDCALPVIEAAGGRTFFLCTTIRAVKQVAERLRTEFAERGLDFPLFVQGERGRTELLDSFRNAGNAVLVGSQSFWEGVDVRGDALSLVIIDKLPFSPPDDPVLAARIDVMEKQGMNGFMHHTLPEAIINLKQGAGRLIRDETDRGVLMMCDPRVISKSYGRRVWQSLPPFKRTRVQAEVIEFFKPGSTPPADAGYGAAS
jgi:ATP-dependent DNA helicase DinG